MHGFFDAIKKHYEEIMAVYKSTLMDDAAIGRALKRIAHEILEKNGGMTQGTKGHSGGKNDKKGPKHSFLSLMLNPMLLLFRANIMA